LVSLKSCVEQGFDVTLFEKESSIGGVWAPVAGKTWNTLHTNTSYFSSMFSDFPWPKDTELFPDQCAMYKYLNDYVDHFGIRKFIKLSSEINTVEKVNGSEWSLKWSNQQGTMTTEQFNYLIVATGVFSRAGKHDIQGLEHFNGEILNVSEYRDANLYRDKRVLVVGTSFSGAEAAGEIGTVSKYPVIQLINKPYYVVKKITNGKPIDAHLYSRELADYLSKQDPTKISDIIHAFYGSLSRENDNVQDLNPDKSLAPFLTISNSYLDRIKDKKVEILLNKECSGFDENGLLTYKKQQQEIKEKIDVIVFCDGYLCQIPFLPKEVKDKMKFIQDDKFLPLLLHKCIFCLDNPTLFFIGMYKGPSYGSMELQARWISMVMAGIIKGPTQKEIEQGIDEEQKVRDQRPRPQLPHPFHIQYCDYMARQIGIYPDDDKLQDIYKQYPQLYKLLYNNLMSVACYRLWNSIYINPNSFNESPCPIAMSNLQLLDDKIYNNSTSINVNDN